MVSLGGAGRHRRLADSDSDEEEESNTLTVAKAAELCPKPFRLIARNAGFTALDDLSTLSALDYIDLSGNKLRGLGGLERNARLKTLLVKGNELENVEGVLGTEAVRVVDASDNRLQSTEWLARAAFAERLLALVVKGNGLRLLECMSCLQSVETVVISNNEVEDISGLAKLGTVKKLSASHNCIRKLPEMGEMRGLVELRLGYNRLVDVDGLRGLRVKILDVGHNRIERFEGLRGCEELVQVNVKGNKVDGSEFVKGVCGKLEVVDGVRIKGGRRKVRINRIRVQAGYAIEKDRKFARLPPGYGEGGENEGGSEDKAEKRKRPAVENQVEDNAVDGAEFVQLAKAKTLAIPQKAAAEETKQKEKTRRRKRIRQETVAFGTGGESQW